MRGWLWFPAKDRLLFKARPVLLASQNSSLSFIVNLSNGAFWLGATGGIERYPVKNTILGRHLEPVLQRMLRR